MRNRQNLLRNKSLTFWGHLTSAPGFGHNRIQFEKQVGSVRYHWEGTEKNHHFRNSQRCNDNSPEYV